MSRRQSLHRSITQRLVGPIRQSVSAAVIGTLASLSGCSGLHDYVDKGCKVGPDYCAPPAPVADEWIDYKNSDIVSESVNYGYWWGEFQDPILDQLIDTASQQNLDLRTAGMQILAARARLDIARGNLFPQRQQAYGAFERSNASGTTANVFPAADYDNWGTGFNASWELDFWGRFRRAIEVQDNLLNVSIENYDDVLVILQSEVATAYIEYRALQARVKYARINSELQERTLGFAEVRFRNERETELPVAQGKEILASTRSAIPALEAALRQTGNAICVLLGQPPRDLTDELGDGPIPEAPGSIFAGIPAELLRRRPDVRRAERIAAAQSARIGVAEADFYPQIAINGFIGVESENLSDLFNTKSVVGSIGPAFRWNILNYGRIRNNVRLNEALFYRTVYAYQSTVLEANREVEDSIIGFLKERDRANLLAESSDAAQRAVEIGTLLYERGRQDYQPVVYMQQQLTERQDQLAVSKGLVASNVVSVYRALGGGWQSRFNGSTPITLPELDAPLELNPELESGAQPLVPDDLQTQSVEDLTGRDANAPVDGPAIAPVEPVPVKPGPVDPASAPADPTNDDTN